MRKAFNHVINFFWTIIAFYPVIHYWYHTGIDHWFIISVSLSLLIAFLPKKFYDLLKFSNSRSFYEKLGVKTIRKFVQNGDFAKKISASKNSSIIESVKDAKRYLQTVEMYSRFHWVCFLFFLFSAIHAISMKQIILAILIFLSNILYNITAILLQQYNRMRIEKIIAQAKQLPL